jgi:hypothetical protein
MNVAFHTVIGARDEERRDLFLTTARRLGTAVQNVEKDFWVCWTLDILFNGLPIGGPRLLFKGGTSLSKGFGLIDRFSEDIDITVFRDDIGAGASVEELEALSGKKRRAKLDAIKAASQTFLNGPFCDALRRQIAETVKAAGIPAGRFRLEPDSDDPDQQTFLLWKWSGRRDSNSRRPPWQGGALPTELRPRIRGEDQIAPPPAVNII